MIFPHTWNVYDLDKNRTNNHMEGWHLHMDKKAKSSSNLWKVIIEIESERTATELEVNQMNDEGRIMSGWWLPVEEWKGGSEEEEREVDGGEEVTSFFIHMKVPTFHMIVSCEAGFNN